nr:RNA-directed DNA polymerase, eukaryota, nucleotide-binding alpha-beta plait domain protein [Tanacetum cinerariifolium]
MHLQANVVRIERPPINTARPSFPSKPDNNGSFSFASVLKGNNIPHVISPSSAMVLDESCIVSCNLDLFVIGEAKNISSIPNLYIILSNEGFHNVKHSYLGIVLYGLISRMCPFTLGREVVKDKTLVLSQRQSEGFCSRVMEDLHQDADHSFSDNNIIGNKGRDSRKGESILDVLDGMVKVGQAMGYDMDGCLKDMENIIGSQGVPDVIQ